MSTLALITKLKAVNRMEVCSSAASGRYLVRENPGVQLAIILKGECNSTSAGHETRTELRAICSLCSILRSSIFPSLRFSPACVGASRLPDTADKAEERKKEVYSSN